MNEQCLLQFAERVADVVTELNGFRISIVNEEITSSDFDDDLTDLFAKLKEVEEGVSRLADLFYG
jgi:hypothetical protein